VKEKSNEGEISFIKLKKKILYKVKFQNDTTLNNSMTI